LEDEAMDGGADDVLDMEDIMGGEINADPNVNYNERAEARDVMGGSQLNLF
jgi:hypothetical protein